MAIKRLPSTGDQPRSTGVPESLVPGGAADSAGFPWAGRTFDHHETAFTGDTGETPSAYADAVSTVRGCAARMEDARSSRSVDRLARAEAELADALADALVAIAGVRLLIPLVAEAGNIGVTPEGRTVEKSQELSIVTVKAPDGRTALPAFSSVDTMRAWNAQSRPIPVPATQAAVAAAQEHTDLIIIDPGSEHLEFGVRRPALESLALAQRLLPPWGDPEVARAFRDAVSDMGEISAVMVGPGDPEARLREAETVVYVGLPPGLDRETLGGVLRGAQERWASEEIIATRVDSLKIVPRTIPPGD